MEEDVFGWVWAEQTHNFAVAWGWSRSKCCMCAGAAFAGRDSGSWIMSTLDLYPFPLGFLFRLNLLL